MGHGLSSNYARVVRGLLIGIYRVTFTFIRQLSLIYRRSACWGFSRQSEPTLGRFTAIRRFRNLGPFTVMVVDSADHALYTITAGGLMLPWQYTTHDARIPIPCWLLRYKLICRHENKAGLKTATILNVMVYSEGDQNDKVCFETANDLPPPVAPSPIDGSVFFPWTLIITLNKRLRW